MSKTAPDPSIAQLRREKALARLRADMRERDSYCGDGFASGKVWSSHGFNHRVDDLGPVATADLDKETGNG